MSILNPTNVRTQTALARATLASERGTAPVKPLSPKNQAIYDAVASGSWGCQKASVHALVKAITGVDVPVGSSGGKSSHQFTVGALYIFHNRPALIRSIDSDGDGRFVTANLEMELLGDGYIDCDVPAQIVVATDEQVDEFIASIGLVVTPEQEG
ncbi:hypothetical protein [Sphingomonas melonis]|uniref:hypothetical protein n=1 Tax=Sphingomonas melonis TaxID=152682 RepID=UPI0035C7B36C